MELLRSIYGEIMSFFCKKKILSIALTMLSTITVSHANATLISVDYVMNSSDNWITSDSLTGLQWLDVPLTANQTFDQVRQSEWFANGFRYATKTELQTLFTNAGTPDDNFNLSITHYFETKALIDLLGATLIATDRITTSGYIGTDYFGYDINLQSHPIGETFSAQLGKLDFFPYFGEAHFTGGHPFSNESSSNYGSFLVRIAPVPEPETYCMILTGLSFVGFITRRRKTT
jgi:PEP-CTERM motif